ncbi:general L-amino acid transport system substrate-binding protein [Azospirillum fermentarium]|uniref:amino acid ABC transporter substrate-binding protein n=1 Tax=Azospirillum fermentarium TaxID=1233114 RepID=UPI0022266215|nr:amino acid ABC transporter substrate-binding protein [Azospirillum fermentarium]MCW2246572.1 general L-amino acid transport system substrate-binding protein [Azospirillum fermentarium]
MKAVFFAATAAIALSVASGAAQAGPTLDAIKQRGFVQCGVNTGLAGFGNPDSAGNWTGLDVDYCRAVAVALFNDPNKVKFTPLSAQQRFPAIQSGEVDMLSRNTTVTLTRDTSVGLNFAPVTYYDGQGFMVPKKLGVKSAKELSGATVCVQSGTTTELNLADYFRTNNLQYNPVVIESVDEVNAAYFAGRCDALTTDASGLAGTRAAVAPNPDDHIILPEIISKEPLAPAVRHGDDQWFDIVKWTVYATIAAEEKGITSKNLDEFLASKDPEIQRMLGVAPGMGAALGLDDKWLYNVIKKMGNYGEIFERNVGVKTPLKLERGLNALWTKGGMQYAMPFR